MIPQEYSPHNGRVRPCLLALAVAAVMFLSGCGQNLFAMGMPTTTPESRSVPESQSTPQVILPLPQSVPGAAPPSVPQDAPAEDYPYETEMLALVNGVLEEYASGVLPEPMRYNTNYSGIYNAVPPDTVLPQAVALPDVRYTVQSGVGMGPDMLLVSFALENEYTMDIQLELDNSGAGRPTRPATVAFYDMQGTHEADFSAAPRGGDFLFLRSDRLYASADFDEVRTEAGIVSGSISWNRANHFLWIDIDSMREPFFYTYFLVDENTLQQDYPQKDWQKLPVISDDRMLTISQSLYLQFREVLESTFVEVETEN